MEVRHVRQDQRHVKSRFIDRVLQLPFHSSSVLQGAMRDRSVPLPGQDRRLLLGPNSGHRDHRQATETSERGLRQLRSQVSPVNFTRET